MVFAALAGIPRPGFTLTRHLADGLYQWSMISRLPPCLWYREPSVADTLGVLVTYLQVTRRWNLERFLALAMGSYIVCFGLRRGICMERGDRVLPVPRTCPELSLPRVQ